MDQEEEISNDEKLRIAQHYLLSSPPGQFNDILAEIRTIVPKDILSDAVASNTARVSYVKLSKVVKSPSGKNTIICQFGEVDESHFFDPVEGVIISVDYLTMAAKATDLDAESYKSNERIRSKVQSSINEYVISAYNAAEAAGGVYTKDGGFNIVISGEKSKLETYWSGKWTSTWSVDALLDSFSIAGSVKIHVHYFEKGNLQMQSTKVVPSKTVLYKGDEQDLAAQIVRYIQDKENEFQTNLQEMYSSMNEQTLKSFRRLLPITHTKVDWNPKSLQLARQLRR